MEKRTRVIVRVNRKESRFKQFFRHHPLLYSIAATIAVLAAVTVASSLINSATSHIPGNGNSQGGNQTNLVPPVAVPPISGGSTSQADPSPTPTPTPYSAGECLAGDFESSDPDAVQKVSCTSGDAHKILASFPGELPDDDEADNACTGVTGTEVAYEEKYVEENEEDGTTATISSYIYCLS
jgi:hypothetical protein